MTFIHKFPAVFLVGCMMALLSSRCHAQTQTLGEAMMASLERPSDSMIPPPLSTELIQTGSCMDGIKRASYHEQSSQYAGHSDLSNSTVMTSGHVSTPGTAGICSQTCDPQCSTYQTGKNYCQEDLSRIELKKREMRRRTYFNYHKHTKTLYPITRPYCLPSYGYYETCWRTLQPQPCYQRSVDGNVHGNSVNHSLQMAPSSGQEPLPPAPIPEELAPRKSYD